MNPGNEVFSEADLEPSPAQRRARWKAQLERVAAVVAVTAAGVWTGGLVALGVIGGLDVFDALPPAFAAEARSSALGSFDGVALGCAAVLLACEMVRSAVAFRRRRTVFGRVRRIAALGLAASVAYLALMIAPGMVHLRRAGAVPGLGDQGAELARLEQRALRVRQAAIPLAVLFMVLQVWTLRSREEDDELASAPAPLPPGPTPSPSKGAGSGSKAVKRYLDADEQDTDEPLPPS